MSSMMYVIYAIVLVLMGVEAIHSYRENKHLYNSKDTLSNFLIAIVWLLNNFVSNSLKMGIYAFTYKWRLFTIKETWWSWILLFILTDLIFYWYHRTSHHVRWFWAAHSVHHSSKEFNLSIGIRNSWTYFLSGHFLFWIILPLIGFSPVIVVLMLQVNLAYNVLLHTETIKKLHPWYEYIFNTPSHHRVHHASDARYLDKNHGGVLIIWDRLFGTFCEEQSHPVYGLTNDIGSYNVLTIQFHEWAAMIRSTISSGSAAKRINYIIQPPGWSYEGYSKLSGNASKTGKSPCSTIIRRRIALR